MAEQAGLKPLTMAEQAGLTLVPPDEPAAPPSAASQVPLTFGDRFSRGALDIGQGIKQRLMQMNEGFYGPKANTDLSVTRYPDSWDGPPKPVTTATPGPSAQGYTDQVNAQLKDYGQRFDTQGKGVNVPWLGKVDLPRLLGSAVATTPAMALGPANATTVGARALAGLLQGGAVGASQFDPTNTATAVAKNTGLGALSGALMNPAVGYAGDKVASGVSTLADRLKGMGTPTPTTEDLASIPGFSGLDIPNQSKVLGNAQAQAAHTGAMDPETISREANLRANGVTPSQAMVTRNPGDWATERNLAKTLQQSPNPALKAQGDRLTATFTNNDNALATKLRSLSSDLPPGSPESFGQTAMNVVDQIQKDTQKGVSALYTQIKEKVGDNVGARPNAILDTINELSTSPAADPMVDAAHRFMVKKGILTKAEDGSFQPDGTMSISQAEALRQHLNAQPDGLTGGFGRAQLIRAVDRDVLDTAGGDAFAGPRAAASARFDALDNPAVQRVLATHGELQQGRTAQGFIQQHVLGAPVQDINALMNTVKSFGTDEQQKTFQNALEAGVMQHLQNQSINGTTGAFSGTALDRSLREIGPERLLAFMSPQRQEALESLRKAAVDATVQPAHSAVNSSNSGAMMLGMGHPGLSGAGIKAYLPGIAHEVLPEGLLNAPQNMAAKSAVNQVLSARTFPGGRPPNAQVLALARALGVGSGAGLANQATQPNNAPPR